MDAVTEIPTWLLWLIGAFIPAVTAVVGAIAIAVSRKTSRREESMRLLRWAGEQAVDPVSKLACTMGMQTLSALAKGGLLDKDDKRLLWAVTQAVLAPPSASYSDANNAPVVTVERLEGYL